MNKLLLLILVTSSPLFSADNLRQLALWEVDGGDAKRMHALAEKIRLGQEVKRDLYVALALDAIAAEVEEDGNVTRSLAQYLNSGAGASLFSKHSADSYYYKLRAHGDNSVPEPLGIQRIIKNFKLLVRDNEKKISVEGYFDDPFCRTDTLFVARAYLAHWRYPEHPLPYIKLSKLFADRSLRVFLEPVPQKAFDYAVQAYELDASYKHQFIDVCCSLNNNGGAAASDILRHAVTEHPSKKIRDTLVDEGLDQRCVVS